MEWDILVAFFSAVTRTALSRMDSASVPLFRELRRVADLGVEDSLEEAVPEALEPQEEDDVFLEGVRDTGMAADR